MNRRESIKFALPTALLAGGAFAPFISGRADPTSELDRFGGWKERKFEATGFFRTEKTDRWWLVTPDGYAFLSFGINHLYPDLFRQKFNEAAWRKYLGIEDLNDWSSFQSALRKWFLRTCDEYGFNTVGVHNALSITNRPEAVKPYLQPIRFIDVPHWKKTIPAENFLDVFSDEFVDHCDTLARKFAAPLKNDPFLLGYAMTDCPLFTEEDCRERTDVIGGARRESRIGWPRRFRSMGADVPGKQAYVDAMREIYSDRVTDFNKTYRTKFTSFDALASAVDWRPDTDLSNPNETRDNSVFLQKVVDRYYQTTRDAIRKYDPNHLFFGDKLNANTDSIDTVLPVTSKYTDVIFYQMYARYEVQEPGLDRWAKVVDKPVINGDSAFTMVTETMPRPYGPIADSLKQRAEWTDEFFRNAFARPEFVGWHYCGLIDATNLILRKKDRQHSGLLDGFGQPYLQLQAVLKKCTDEMYDLAE